MNTNDVMKLLMLLASLSLLHQATLAADQALWPEVKQLSNAKSRILERHAFSTTFRRHRSDSVKALITIIEDKNLPLTVRLEAVRMVGEIRAPEAVDVLLIHLNSLRAEKISETTMASGFPCVPSLIKIGKPASFGVLKEFHKPVKKLRRFALAVVLAGVEGRQVGRFMLQREIAKAKTPEERRNLQAGLKAFLSMTANERTAEELKAEERKAEERKRKRK